MLYRRIRYGNIELLVRDRDIIFNVRKNLILRHYIDTNKSLWFNQGITALEISGIFYALTEAAKQKLEEVFYGPSEEIFTYGGRYYNKTITGEHMSTQNIAKGKPYYEIDTSFIALDPVPYSINSGEALY